MGRAEPRWFRHGERVFEYWHAPTAMTMIANEEECDYVLEITDTGTGGTQRRDTGGPDARWLGLSATERIVVTRASPVVTHRATPSHSAE